jgi:hypothetical protein
MTQAAFLRRCVAGCADQVRIAAATLAVHPAAGAARDERAARRVAARVLAQGVLTARLYKDQSQRAEIVDKLWALVAKRQNTPAVSHTAVDGDTTTP